MILYYDFEGKRMNAEVSWPKNADTVQVILTDKRLKHFPADLLFDLRNYKISYTIEDPANKRLIDLQNVLAKRLQEFAGQM